LVSLLIVVSCGDDDDAPILPPAPDLAALWPNADGSSWSYDFEQRVIPAGEIAALAGFDISNPARIDPLDIEERLMQAFPQPIPGVTERRGVLDMQLHGLVLTATGPRQNLESNLRCEGKSRPREISPVMLRVYRARPDLREEMIARGLVPPTVDIDRCINSGPLYAHGGLAFQVGDEAMGYLAACNDATGSCIIACEPLTANASFVHPILPAVDPAIREYGWVLGPRTIDTEAERFENATAFVYLYDFGACLVPVNGGDDIVPFHAYALSILVCAPGVGPVYQRGIDVLAPRAPEFGMTGEIGCHEATLRAYALTP